MKDQKGFTLIELIVILGLATIVMGAVMSFFIANYRSYNRLNTESELQYQSQYIINFMTDKILAAEKYEEDGKYKFYVDDKCIYFWTDGDSLMFEDEDNPGEKAIGSSISEFKVASISPNEVKIDLTLEKQKVEVKASQTVYMRNSNK